MLVTGAADTCLDVLASFVGALTKQKPQLRFLCGCTATGDAVCPHPDLDVSSAVFCDAA